MRRTERRARSRARHACSEDSWPSLNSPNEFARQCIKRSARACPARRVFTSPRRSSRIRGLRRSAWTLSGAGARKAPPRAPVRRARSFRAALRGVKISPDGKLVAYLKARDDDKDRFDLWAFDVRRRAPPPAGRFAHAGGRRPRFVGRRRGAARAPAHLGLFGHRRIQLRARQPPAADPAEWRPVRLRPCAQAGGRRAPAYEAPRLRNRRALLAAFALREFRARPESLRDRPRERHGTRR